ncbi:TPA: DUF3895 domain-containing protein [Bacillus cereus]|jgi:hypothetical protein|uniref:DUF3895 domain-containing protein n=1 Tax=Bacillus cereus group TaxID=86661 RepID=UPI0019267252|nr:DUF3895 domain-containing protein [Bacillus mobilis]MBL3853642.1 DUF3895 domain-containing protein [Bacillus cereus]MDG1622446.1 DUF3895 domain-containing protein [Bacillus mobilis]HDR4600561.1 DUF3895 domain-containing protein [Bacillus cereus]HDR4658154.1 DUF3895 domain-containing protein [Bacillus cereus]HDR7981619.1 DUF3895 domain-containing protein [Bacillus cereus]
MSGIHLVPMERDIIFNGLSDEQQEYLRTFLKRGKQASFSSVLARLKGGESEDDAEHISTQWILIDYIDAGEVSHDYLCECGRPLRYQYVVKNLVTDKILKFGKNHFEEHTGLSSEIVSAVIKGMHKIDKELDEILSKISSEWSLIASLDVDFIPDDLVVPSDIQEHFDLGLPLLDRQIVRLKEEIRIHNSLMKKNQFELDNVDLLEVEEEQFSLFDEEIDDNSQVQSYRVEPVSDDKNVLYRCLSFVEQEFILTFIEKFNSISTRQLCEFMIKEIASSDKRYATGKPHIYVYVCSYLDFLVSKGKLNYVENMDYMDRVYYKESNIS